MNYSVGLYGRVSFPVSCKGFLGGSKLILAGYPVLIGDATLADTNLLINHQRGRSGR